MLKQIVFSYYRKIWLNTSIKSKSSLARSWLMSRKKEKSSISFSHLTSQVWNFSKMIKSVDLTSWAFAYKAHLTWASTSISLIASKHSGSCLSLTLLFNTHIKNLKRNIIIVRKNIKRRIISQILYSRQHPNLTKSRNRLSKGMTLLKIRRKYSP